MGINKIKKIYIVYFVLMSLMTLLVYRSNQGPETRSPASCKNLLNSISNKNYSVVAEFYDRLWLFRNNNFDYKKYFETRDLYSKELEVKNYELNPQSAEEILALIDSIDHTFSSSLSHHMLYSDSLLYQKRITSLLTKYDLTKKMTILQLNDFVDELFSPRYHKSIKNELSPSDKIYLDIKMRFTEEIVRFGLTKFLRNRNLLKEKSIWISVKNSNFTVFLLYIKNILKENKIKFKPADFAVAYELGMDKGIESLVRKYGKKQVKIYTVGKIKRIFSIALIGSLAYTISEVLIEHYEDERVFIEEEMKIQGRVTKSKISKFRINKESIELDQLLIIQEERKKKLIESISSTTDCKKLKNCLKENNFPIIDSKKYRRCKFLFDPLNKCKD